MAEILHLFKSKHLAQLLDKPAKCFWKFIPNGIFFIYTFSNARPLNSNIASNKKRSLSRKNVFFGNEVLIILLVCSKGGFWGGRRDCFSLRYELISRVFQYEIKSDIGTFLILKQIKFCKYTNNTAGKLLMFFSTLMHELCATFKQITVGVFLLGFFDF